MTAPRPVLIFDGDCGFCTTAARFARRRVARHQEYAVAPWQDLDLTAYGLTERDCREAARFVDGSGRVRGGHLAIIAALRHGSRPWPALGAAVDTAPLRRLAAVIYRWVADHRYAMPGGTPACAVRPAAPPSGRRAESSP